MSMQNKVEQAEKAGIGQNIG
eukprot:SAG31_NODE_45981_length_256_cov_0.980892_1_plen_20_part_10